MRMFVRACMRVCVRACVRACVPICLRACLRALHVSARALALTLLRIYTITGIFGKADKKGSPFRIAEEDDLSAARESLCTLM